MSPIATSPPLLSVMTSRDAALVHGVFADAADGAPVAYADVADIEAAMAGGMAFFVAYLAVGHLARTALGAVAFRWERGRPHLAHLAAREPHVANRLVQAVNAVGYQHESAPVTGSPANRVALSKALVS